MPTNRCKVGRSIATKVDVSVEFCNDCKGDSGFWNALHLSPVFSEAGDLPYFFGNRLDVTKRCQAEATMQGGQALHAPGNTDAGIAQELESLTAGVTGSLAQARANPSSGRQARQLAHAAWEAERAGRFTRQLLGAQQQPDEEGRPGWATAAPLGGDGAALVLRPVRVDAQGEDEEGCLVFNDDRLVAVLVRLSSQHGALAGRWHLEHGFGALGGLEHPNFANLDAARGWVGRRLGRSDGA